MKESLKRVLTLVLAIAFTVTLVACGGNNTGNIPATTAAPTTAATTTEPTSTVPAELYKVNVFSELSNYAGDQTGWFAKVLKDKFNMEFNIISSNLEGGDTKFATMMASGDLGDIYVSGDSGDHIQNAIKAKLLLDWHKDDLIGKYGNTIKTLLPKAIKKSEVNLGGGTALYGIGHDATNMPNGPSEGADMTYHPDLRYDLYEKIGKPEIKTMEDYLPVLKQMQALEPKSDSGKPTYGFSLWADWDSTIMTLAKQFATMYGYDTGDGFNSTAYLLIHATEPKYQKMLDPDSYYMRSIKLYYTANQMGLVDPDSISQKNADVINKYTDGQVLFCWFPWMDNAYNTPERTAQGKGFKLVPFTDELVYSYGFTKFGGSRIWTIGAKAKYPERIMQFLDWMYTPEGVMTSNWGPQGMNWDIKDGAPYVTEFGMTALPANAVGIPAEYGGGTFKDGMNQINNTTLKLTTINPETNEPYDYHIWKSYLTSNQTQLDKNWSANMGGALTAKEWLEKNNKIVAVTSLFTGTAPALKDETMQQQMGQVSTVVKQYSWKMIFAKDQTQYDSLYNEMMTKAKGLGYDDIVNWEIKEVEKVFEYRKNPDFS